MKALQKFSPAYLEQCKKMTPQQIVQFLDDFRKLQEPPQKSKLISLKVNEQLLETFRKKCEIEGLKYQTQIKKLMEEWL